jgi:N-methylhydantoinase A
LTTAGSLGGFPLKLSMVDVLSIGAGGGSIARVAPDGRWHVGPDSAGAIPGPVSYGRGGGAVTLTDAELVLGRLPEALLGGELPLDRAAAARALAEFGAARGFDAERTARGVLAIASHAMCGAIRRVSVQRGQDPSALALLAMGGGGPLHGAELAGLLGMRTVIVPPQPGLAAAYGLLVADVLVERVQVVGEIEEVVDPARLEDLFGVLGSDANALLAAEGVPPAARVLERKLDLRYAGMSHELTVECPAGARGRAALSGTIETFHRRFQALSGHADRAREAVEIVNLRVAARGLRAKPALPHPPAASDTAPAPRARRAVTFLGAETPVASAIYARSDCAPGARIAGPAVIEQLESTTVVPPAWCARVDERGNLILRPSGG